MKKILLYFVLFTLSFIGKAQIVNIPDPNFKNYLVNNTNINTNGDNEIQVSEAQAYDGGIYVSTLHIQDLTGIEAFPNIIQLTCSGNQLTSIDLSHNTSLFALDCYDNAITSLILPNGLEYLTCAKNNLTNLDVSNLTRLSDLDCSNNSLIDLDVSQNSQMINLNCSNNNLNDLNVANGNNVNFQTFNALNNPNLTCIQVDDVTYSNNNWANYKDLPIQYYFS
jgi:hypothetical protein